MMLVVSHQESEYPLVVIGIFIQQPTPFVTVFFERLLKLQYPKNRLKLFIYNQVTSALHACCYGNCWSKVTPSQTQTEERFSECPLQRLRSPVGG